jgi:hypothetical protein
MPACRILRWPEVRHPYEPWAGSEHWCSWAAWTQHGSGSWVSCWCGNHSNSWETSIVLDSKDWSLYAHVITVGCKSPPLNWPATFFCQPVVPWATIQHVRICDLQRFRHQWQWRLASSVSRKSSSQVGFVYFQAWDPCPMLISHSSLFVVSYRSSLTKLSQLSFLEWGCHVNQLATPHGESSGVWLFRHPPVRPIIIAKATDQVQRGWYNLFFVDTSFDWCRCLVLWLQPQESIARLRRISTFEGASASSTLDCTRTELMECAWWQMPWTPLVKHEGAAASHEFSWMIIEQLRALFFRSAIAGLSPCHWDFASPFSILPRL